MRGKADVAFAAVLGLIGLLMVYEAWAWPFAARMLPLALGIPFLVLVVILQITFWIEVRSRGRGGVPDAAAVAAGSRDDGGAARRPSQGADVVVVDDASPLAYAIHGAWFVAFTVLVWLLGFPLGGTLSVAAYLVYARRPWPVVALLTLMTAAFFWAAIAWLKIGFPDPLLW